MENLPQEVLIEIFKHLDGHSLFYATKVCRLWSSIINNSTEITSNFTYKIFSGANIMPDFMDYKVLRDFVIGRRFNRVDDAIKFKKFYPNLRSTEVTDFSDNNNRIDEIMDIFEENGKLWKSMTMHNVKLMSAQRFADIFETLVNVNKLKILNCEVSHADEEEEMMPSDPLPRLKHLEASQNDSRIFRALKHCRTIELLDVTSENTTSDDLTDLLVNNPNLRTLICYGTAKEALNNSKVFPFHLEHLTIERSDLFTVRNDPSFCYLSQFEEFLKSQRNSLSTFKFKGRISQRDIANLSKMKLKEINLHFMGTEEESETVDERDLSKNRTLEKLTCIGSFTDLNNLLKHFNDVKFVEFNATCEKLVSQVFITLCLSLPNLEKLKIWSKIQIPPLNHLYHKLNHLKWMRITVKDASDITRALKCCPNLKQLSIISEFQGEIVDADCVTLDGLEELEITSQGVFNGEKMLTSMHQIIQSTPNIKKLTINSQLDGTLDIEAVNMLHLETLKIDFTCTDDQCNNMYELIKNCPNLKILEMNSRLVGSFNIDGLKMERLESVLVMGIDEGIKAFQNVLKFLKAAPNLKKIDFWIRGNAAETYKYRHSDLIESFETETFNLEELKIWKFCKSERGILSYLMRCSPGVKKLYLGSTSNDDIDNDMLAEIFDYGKDLEELYLSKEYTFDRENLTIIKNKLTKLKKITIFVARPLQMRKVVYEIFGPCNIEFVYNPDCLEEWEGDDIAKV